MSQLGHEHRRQFGNTPFWHTLSMLFASKVKPAGQAITKIKQVASCLVHVMLLVDVWANQTLTKTSL
jgi:hypothetical protein